VAEAMSQSIDADLEAQGVVDVTAKHREGSRLVKNGKSALPPPTVIHAAPPAPAVVKNEFMFPFVTVVECPEARMVEAIGPTLVCSAMTDKPALQRGLLDATQGDRL